MLSPEDFFRALSDSTRLRCLLLLLSEGEACVCELVHALELSQPRVSRHLGQLRDMGIVRDQRRGQWVYYRLSPELPEWAREVLESVFAAEAVTELRRRLASMPNRPFISCD